MTKNEEAPDDCLTATEGRFYELVHPGAPKGVLNTRPELRDQDDVAGPAELYCVVFFPRISNWISASIQFHALEARLARTPEAAIAKFMDGLAPGQTWATYHDAGHRVRKLQISDLGDAERGNTLSTEAPKI